MMQPLSIARWWPLTALVASVMALLVMPTTVSGLNLRAGPAPAPASAPAAAPARAPAPIRPGIVVQITTSKEQLTKDFAAVKTIHHVPLMDEMLGKTLVVKELAYGGVGLASPNGSQDNVWYFPAASLTPWLDTSAAKEVPVSSKANKAMGLPTSPKLTIGPPGRHDSPWAYTIKGKNLMEPIAPPYNEKVDLVKTSAPFPPWRKVKEIVSVECMEKLHKDPSHLCRPEAYKDYNMVTPAPTPEKPLTKADAKKLKDKIKHLETTIDNLTPKEAKQKFKMDFKAPGVKDSKSTLIKANIESNHHSAADGPGKTMEIGNKPSKERLITAQGHGEKQK